MKELSTTESIFVLERVAFAFSNLALGGKVTQRMLIEVRNSASMIFKLDEKKYIKIVFFFLCFAIIFCNGWLFLLELCLYDMILPLLYFFLFLSLLFISHNVDLIIPLALSHLCSAKKKKKRLELF